MKSKELTYTDFNQAAIKLVELHQELVECRLEKKIEDYAIAFVANDGKQKIVIEIVENEPSWGTKFILELPVEMFNRRENE